MTDHPTDTEIAALADRLDAERPRPSRGLRRRVRDVLATGLRERALRRRAVWLVIGGTVALLAAAALAVNLPS